MEVRYIEIKDNIDGEEFYSLARIVNTDKGLVGELYSGYTQWEEYEGAFSYLPDPSPAEFVDEERAREVMTIIDRQESEEKKFGPDRKQALIGFVGELAKKYSFKIEATTFDSGAVMIDIFLKNRLYVVEIKDDTIALSEVNEEADGFTLPDELFTEEEKFKEKLLTLVD